MLHFPRKNRAENYEVFAHSILISLFSLSLQKSTFFQVQLRNIHLPAAAANTVEIEQLSFPTILNNTVRVDI